MKQYDGRYELLFPSQYIGAADLQGRDITITIAKVGTDQLQMQGGGKQKKVIVELGGAQKKWVLNKTNAKRIAKLYGPVVKDWVGKSIILYEEQVEAFGEMVPAVRVRPTMPSLAPDKAQPPPEPASAADAFGFDDTPDPANVAFDRMATLRAIAARGNPDADADKIANLTVALLGMNGIEADELVNDDTYERATKAATEQWAT